MNSIIDAAIDRSRAVLLVLLLIFVAGYSAYSNIPREHAPEVKIPIIYTVVTQEGISPEDAERMILRPLEKELQLVEGIKEMRSNASLGRASVILEFNAGFDSDAALADVREKVDQVKPELPEEAEEPTVNEVNFSLFPVLNVILTGNVPERTLLNLARDLRDEIESVPSVLSVEIAGDREEELAIIMDPLLMESYGVSREMIPLVSSNNQLVTAGTLDSGVGSYDVKVPGLVETLQDILTIPLKANGNAVVTVGDVGDLRKTFKDPTGFAWVNGQRSIALEVSKRTGENIIDTVAKVRKVVEEESKYWPEGINVVFAQDVSNGIIDMVSDLQNSIFLAMILVMVVIIAIVGLRSAGFVAMAIPGAFLFGIICISLMDLTLNIVVLFSLILSVGMLVDSAIVVTEYADRQMIEGSSHKVAYGAAAKRMSWPIIASTITTIAVFMPLLFWPGVVGQFMSYMPITVMVVLAGSLLMALIFIPTLGTYLGKRPPPTAEEIEKIDQAEKGDIWHLTGFTGSYVRLLDKVVNNAGKFALGLFSVLLFVFFLYGAFNHGMEFFPKVEPDNIQVQIRARGNLSVFEKDKLSEAVEDKIIDMKDDVKIFYTRSGRFDGGNQDLPKDVIGVVQMELHDWGDRRKADDIMADIKERTKDIAGIVIETREEQKGPPSGKPVMIELGSRYPYLLPDAVVKVLDLMKQSGGLKDIEDSRPAPAIEWEVLVDREKALRYGITVQSLGEFVQLVTKGLKITTYRPDDADDEVDVVIKYPEAERNLTQLENIRVITAEGAIPISNFVEIKPRPKVNLIERVDGKRTLTIKADIEKGVLADDKVKDMTQRIINSGLDPRVAVKFKGEDEQQKETGDFLSGAFGLALFAMALILVIQFNRIYNMVIIMSAVFLSTVGVLLGLLITGQPFGMVMCGVGIISLAGIVVNNNIIFIDTYQLHRAEGMGPEEALLRTGAQRMRPILLTAGTTVLGLIPMVAAMQIDFVDRSLSFGAPSTQWWRQLSTTIAGGLAFATILTLFFTPALLMLGERMFKKKEESYMPG